MSIIMHDHIHLRNACNLIIDLDSIKVFLRKIVPIAVVIRTAFFVILGGLMANVV